MSLRAAGLRILPHPQGMLRAKPIGVPITGLAAMDARIYFHLSDAIATAETSGDLAATGDLIRATEMTPLERRALETREAQLRSGDVAAPPSIIAPRGD